MWFGTLGSAPNFGMIGRENRVLAKRLAVLWREKDFDRVGVLTCEAAKSCPSDTRMAMLLVHLHYEGLVDFQTARTALEACCGERDTLWMLLNLLWSREGAPPAALQVAKQLEHCKLADHIRLRIAAFLFDAGEVDAAMDEYRRLKRRVTFGFYRRGYVRLCAEAARRGLDQSSLAAKAQRIDERLLVDRHAVQSLLELTHPSVALVANGPTEGTCGSAIDGHDCVLRMNNHDVNEPGAAALIGKRTDIWIRPAHRNMVPIPKHAIPCIILTGCKVTDRFSNGVDLLTPFLTLDAKIELVPFSLYRDLFSRLGAVPSTGALAMGLVHNVQGNLRRNQLFGFKQSFNTRATSLYRNKIVVGATPNRHDWSAEADLLAQYVGEADG